MNPEPNTTPICGRPVPYVDDVIDLEQLRFWDANPRVAAAVRGLPEWSGADSDQRQHLITKCMEKQESTRNVLEGLKLHHGQQEHLIVDLRGNIVIEGNSRLAAMRMLAHDNPGHWGAAECRCYNDLTDEERFALIAEMHVSGKTEWTPYAKAITYWRQHHELKWDFGKIARVNRTSVPHVKTQLATVDLMAAEDELDERKHSWYNVLTSVRSVNRVFEDNEGFRARILTCSGSLGLCRGSRPGGTSVEHISGCRDYPSQEGATTTAVLYGATDSPRSSRRSSYDGPRG